MNTLKLGSILAVKQPRDTADEGESATLVRMTLSQTGPIYILLYEHLGYEGFTPAQLAEEIAAGRLEPTGRMVAALPALADYLAAPDPIQAMIDAES